MAQIFELKTREDWEKGIFDGTTLIERVAPSGIGTAQLILDANYQTYYPIEVDDPSIEYSGVWEEEDLVAYGSMGFYHVMSTKQRGAQAVAEFEGFGVDLFYMSHPRGGVAKLEIDDIILENIDMYGMVSESLYGRYFLGHGTHRLALKHTGRARATSYWLGTVRDVIGTSVSPNVTLYPRVEDTEEGNWGVYAETSSTFYLLNRRTDERSDSFYISDIRRRVFVPGVSVTVGPASLLIGGDLAAFSTYAPKANIDGLRVYTVQEMVGRYASPVFDSLEADTNYWPLIGFETRIPEARNIALYGKVGDTPVPDSSWSIAAAQDMAVTGEYSDSLYGESQRFGFEDLPVGQYFQFETQLASITDQTESPSLQNMKLFFVPMKKDRFFNYLPQPYTTWLINGLTRFLGAIRSVLLWLNKTAKDLVNSYSISYATDDYLTVYGEELRVPRRFRESEEAYRTRLLAMFQGYGLGGRKDFLETVISAYVGQTVTVLQRTPYTVGWVMGSSFLGIDTYLGSHAVDTFTWDVYIPSLYTGVVEDQIREFIDYLRPVGTIYNIIWT